MLDLLVRAGEIFRRHLTLIIFFSIPAFAAWLLPLLLPAPTYSALGATFLRWGSMPEIGVAEWAFVAVIFGVTLFLLSLAAVALNLIVKAFRTRTRIRAEQIAALGRYSVAVFFCFAAVIAIKIALLIALRAWGLPDWPVYGYAFAASLCLFYIAPAVVHEGLKPVPAMASSASNVIRKPDLFVVWLVLAFVLISAVRTAVYLLEPIIPLAALNGLEALINSLVILPYLIILQAEMYLRKWTIIR